MSDLSSVDLLGLRISSDFPIPSGWPVDDAACDEGISVTYAGECVAPDDDPPGETVAAWRWGDRKLYTVAKDDEGYLFRLHSIAEFRIAGDMSKVEALLAPGHHHGYLGVLMGGTIAAFLLGYHHRVVLHGSTVYSGDRALSFIGESGMGKSTMAAQFMAAGYGLVSDDVLPVDVTGTPAVVGSASEIRLRASAEPIVERMEDRVTVRRTADDRLAVRSAVRPPTNRLQLDHIVVPRPRKDGTPLGATRLAGRDAMRRLLEFPRIFSWSEPSMRRLAFEGCAAIASDVAVWEVDVPWGPPFDPQVPARIAALLGFPEPA